MNVETISKQAFEQLAGPTAPIYTLLECYRAEEVIGAVLLDRIDKDWSWVVLTKLDGQFRAVDLQVSRPTIDDAREKLHAAMRQHGRSS